MGKKKVRFSAIRRVFVGFLFIIIFIGSGFIIRSLAQSLSSTTYFAGCLQSTSKTLYEVSFGSTSPPEPTCRAGDSAVNWANGDILSVTAGTGLSGGGLSGDVGVSIAPSYQLPQNCTNGQVPKWNSSSNTWECRDINSYVAGSGLSLVGNQFSIADSGIMTTKLADNSVTSEKIANITRMIMPQVIGWPSETFGVASYGIRLMPSGGQLSYTFAVPYDYAGGNLTVREWWQVNDQLGTATLFRTSWKVTSGGTVSGIETATPHYYTNDVSWGGQRAWNLPASWFSKGDILNIIVQRRGDLPENTMGRLDFVGVAVEYTADQ